MKALKQKWKHNVNVHVLLVKMSIRCKFKVEYLVILKKKANLLDMTNFKQKVKL